MKDLLFSMKYLILIPAYNEALNIEKTVSSLLSVLPAAEYVVVNDGSGDNTAAICRANGYPLLDLPVNLGLPGAFQTGIRFAYEHGYDAALQFDADGQHDASCISLLTEEMEKTGADIVIGSRFVSERKSASLRMLGSRMITAVIRLTTGVTVTDPTSGMRLYGKKMLRRYATGLNYGPEPDTLAYLIRSGCNISEVQVIMHERTAGKSYLTLGRSIKYMTDMILSILFIQFFRKKEFPD